MTNRSYRKSWLTLIGDTVKISHCRVPNETSRSPDLGTLERCPAINNTEQHEPCSRWVSKINRETKENKEKPCLKLIINFLLWKSRMYVRRRHGSPLQDKMGFLMHVKQLTKNELSTLIRCIFCQSPQPHAFLVKFNK